MDLVTVRCAKCDSKLGNLVNLWTQIGKKYITPVAHTEEKGDADKISATGAVRIGDAGTLVEGWYEHYLPLLIKYFTIFCRLQLLMKSVLRHSELRDAECSSCHTNIGQKCITSPPNHIFAK